MACLSHWCCWRVWPDGVIQRNFVQNLCHFTCLCAWASEGFFPGVALVDFSKSFSEGRRKVVKFVFYHSKLKKQLFVLKFSKSCPFQHPACVLEKICATPLKNWCNLKRFNTSLNSQILLNLICKIKYLTDQIQLWSCFYIGKTKQLYLFPHW